MNHGSASNVLFLDIDMVEIRQVELHQLSKSFCIYTSRKLRPSIFAWNPRTHQYINLVPNLEPLQRCTKTKGRKVWCLQMEIINVSTFIFLKYVAILCLSTTVCVGLFEYKALNSPDAELYYSTIDVFFQH